MNAFEKFLLGEIENYVPAECGKALPSSLVSDGETFLYNGIEFVRLGKEQGGVLCITKKIWKDLPFWTEEEDSPARYRGSIVDRNLEEDFLRNINQEDILPLWLDVTKTSCDSRLRGAGEIVIANVGLLSLAQCKRYKNVMPVFNRPIWTCSPYYFYSDIFCCVYSGGYASYFNAYGSYGCAPVLLFKNR